MGSLALMQLSVLSPLSLPLWKMRARSSLQWLAGGRRLLPTVGVTHAAREVHLVGLDLVKLDLFIIMNSYF